MDTGVDSKSSLVVIAGPLKGAVVPLGKEAISIGRDPTNRLSVADRGLSRRHCVVHHEQDRVTIKDLDSLNGTFVNGVPVKEGTLADGDLVKAGDSVFIFLRDSPTTAPYPGRVQIDDQNLLVGSTIRLRREEARYLEPEARSTPPSASRAVQDLTALLRISRAIHAIHELEALQKRLLELTLQAVPADWGAILLRGEGEEELSSLVSCATDGTSGPMPLSRTIALQVASEGAALLCNDIQEDGNPSGATSAVTSGVRSVLCAPLSVLDSTLGVLYLASRSPEAHFDENHLELVTAIASIAAVAIESARQLESLERETRRLRTDLELDHAMIGESADMKEVYELVAKIAPTDSTVLIRGESGTGKELVARAIHGNSRRATKPFVGINCAALTETLLESELFGHEKGAFTGAISQKQGRLEIANGGTVFLDEVGELPPAVQVKLLRVLQEREFERVGGTRSIKVDLRLLAATHRDLEEAVKKGTFRHDLYYRLNVVPLTLPPLRKRREDIPLLANYFVRKYSTLCNRKVRGLSQDARRCLMRYDWPGNVRELENVIERAVVLGSSLRILPEDLPEVVLESAPPAGDSLGRYHEAVREKKREVILKAVKEAGGSYAAAARLLGLQRTYLHRLIRTLRLKEQLKGGSDERS